MSLMICCCLLMNSASMITVKMLRFLAMAIPSHVKTKKLLNNWLNLLFEELPSLDLSSWSPVPQADATYAFETDVEEEQYGMCGMRIYTLSSYDLYKQTQAKQLSHNR